MTSDKILLYCTISVVGTFVAIDLLHYINYKRGDILDFAAIEQRDFIAHEEDGVHYLVLDGPMRTFFYPANELKIDVDRDRALHLHYQRHGDTLHVLLDNGWSRGAHDLDNTQCWICGSMLLQSYPTGTLLSIPPKSNAIVRQPCISRA